jgi:glyceraldehyde-3-phosphate dehydrogenase/erythrose-4-phosphate dehydrogenase
MHLRRAAHRGGDWANLVKVLGWYHNEWGYTGRLVDRVTIIGGARG